VVLQRALSFLRPIAKEQQIRIVMATRRGLEGTWVLFNPLFYTLVNLCMKLLNEQYQELRIEAGAANDTVAVSVTATFREGFKPAHPADLIPRTMLDSSEGDISVQRKKNGQCIVLRLPLANVGSSRQKLKSHS
jgi:hypothetical protein